MRKSGALLVTIILLSACSGQPVSVKTDESASHNARFIVQNRSDRDVQEIRFELTYRTADGATVRVDTTGYNLTLGDSGQPVPFVRAHEEAFFVRRLPPGSVAGQARVLKVAFVDGTTWAATK
jgi:hypothetical protein